MCQAFVDNGHEVVLLLPHQPDLYEKDVENVFEYYGVKNVFEIRRLWWLPFKGRGQIFGFLAGSEVWKIRPDIVYGRYLSAIWWAALFGYKVIFEVHTPAHLLAKSGRNLAMFDNLMGLKNFLHLVVISDALRDAIRDRTKGRKIIVAHDGAEIPNQDANEQKPTNLGDFSQSGDNLKIGYVGHLYPGKGGELIVELARRISEIRFHVFGGYKEDIDRLNQSALDNVLFHGFIPPSKVNSVLSTLDVLLLPPSHEVTPFGGKGDIGKFMSPLKMFEYMAVGKGIIASDLPVLREVLKPEHNCLMAPPDNVGQWEKALVRLMSDSALRERLGNQARRDLQEKYTWEKRAARVLGTEIY